VPPPLVRYRRSYLSPARAVAIALAIAIPLAMACGAAIMWALLNL
jgi:hypothetical protein